MVPSSLRVIRVFEKLHPECMGFGSAVSEDVFKCHDCKKEQQSLAQVVFCDHLYMLYSDVLLHNIPSSVQANPAWKFSRTQL